MHSHGKETGSHYHKHCVKMEETEKVGKCKPYQRIKRSAENKFVRCTHKCVHTGDNPEEP